MTIIFGSDVARAIAKNDKEERWAKEASAEEAENAVTLYAYKGEDGSIWAVGSTWETPKSIYKKRAIQ